MSPETGSADGWALTRAISPRDRVRVATTDASGMVLNQYVFSHRTDGAQPTAPWAVYLANETGFHLLAFDLDTKHGAETAARDAVTLSGLLADHGIEHLVCQSGPTGGQHLWVALNSPAAPHLVASLARLIAATCPSLDLAPLSNPTTGCVRPPGAPHRGGGSSTVLTGHTDTLLQPTTSPEQLHQLAQHLAATINAGHPEPAVGRSGGISTDTGGHPYLPGTKRPLPPGSAAALQQHPGSGDASTILWKVLVGAAANHWHLADLAEHALTAPGFEHLRSRRISGDRRQPRGARDRAQTLARQWGYAVAFAATTPRNTGADATFDHRAGTIADTIRTLQKRADASPGRWQHGGGPADRRVLDTLHSYALTAVTTAVEADVRRIALTCGIGRETARIALTRLAADGWISLARDSAGMHGAVWQIDPQQLFHREADTARSQAATRPEGSGAAERTLNLETLNLRLRLLNHDTFTTNHALPHAAGNSYARLSPTLPTISTDPTEMDVLEHLAQYGLAICTPIGWTRSSSGVLDAIASRLAVTGRLLDRRNRYRAEREVWSWWQAEHEWMTTPRAERGGVRPDQQNPLWRAASDSRYPKHPRRSDGRADYAAARAARARGALDAVTLAA